jgi:hypothetical protein
VIRIKQYRVFLTHDKGRAVIRVPARNKKVARDLIMKAEGCPARAIQSVEVYEADGLTLEKYRKYLLKVDKDLKSEYRMAQNKALKAKDYQRYLQLRSEYDGAFHAMVCLIRAANDNDFVDNALTYIK